MIQLDTILTYDIEIDFISENEIVLNFDSGLSVYANGVKKVSGVRAIDFFDGTNTSVQVDLHSGRARVYVNSSGGGGAGTWGTITGTLSNQADLQSALDLKQDEAIVVNASLTAANDGVYHVTASATFTDPTGVEGKGYTVFVRNGTATVGATGYSVAGTVLRRVYYSAAWATYFLPPFSGEFTQGSFIYAGASGILSQDNSNLFYDASNVIHYLGGNSGAFTNTRFHATGTVNSYIQNNIRNLSTGAAASSDFVATADDGTDITKFINMGINSSGWSGTGMIDGQRTAYVYAKDVPLSIGTDGSTTLKLFTGGTASTNERISIDSSGGILMGGGTITASTRLDVRGTGTTTANIFRFANSSNTTRFILNDQGDSTLTGKFNIVGATLSGNSLTDNFFNITATMPNTMSTSAAGINFNITGSGTSAQTSIAFRVNYAAGYSGSNPTLSGYIFNSNAGTNSTAPNSNTFGNIGLRGEALGTTTGHNYGMQGVAYEGNLNVGLIGVTQNAKNNATNIAVAGLSRNTGTTPKEIAGYFALVASTTALPTSISAALIANNGSTTADILKLQDNGTDVFTVADGGIVTVLSRLRLTQGADVASVAGAITLGTDGNVFEITGTNAITRISNVNWQNGSFVTLVFTSTASLTDGTANSGTDIGFELAGGANFTGSADDTITLVLSEMGGTQRWREVCRSVN